MNLSNSEKLVHSVLQLEILDKGQKMTGFATGFIVAFLESETSSVPVIVTNRHVFENAAYIGVTFTVATEEGLPDIGKTVSSTIDAAHAIMHPDQSVDLAILPIADALNRLYASGNKPFYAYLQTNLIPTENDLNNFDAIESVIMAGYPVGLRDTVNNFPIVRRGITATPIRIDYMGRPEFLVDMPCFKGCSGAPVFMLDEMGYRNRNGGIVMGSPRIYLLGVQYSVTYANEKPHLPDGTDMDLNEMTVPVYMDIGHIIKSSALLDFEPILRQIAGV